MFTRRYAAAVVLVAATVLQGCAHQSAQEKEDTAWAQATSAPLRRILAPQGTLRVAMYKGSPTSFVQPDPDIPPRGVGYELGEAFARKLGVPFEPKVYPNNAQALQAVADGEADFTFTNATPQRARGMDFSPTVLDVEKSVLVAAKSRLKTLNDVRKAGIRIGVSAGSSTANELKPIYPKAKLVPVDTLDNAIDLLLVGRIDAFATNDAILFEMSDKLRGSRVLPDHWGMEHFAIGVPKGRANAQQWIADFVKESEANGLVQAAAQRAHLRGVVQPK